MNNKKLGKTFDTIINKALGAAKVRLAAKKAKELARATKSLESANLVGKLAACSGRKPELNALSKSEIVVPIIVKNEVKAVIDIDAPIYNRFTQVEADMLKEAAKLLAPLFL